jgi:hypothetical protein
VRRSVWNEEFDVSDQPKDQKEISTADWLVGGGEMGALIRSMDWSKTPLGPIESWPRFIEADGLSI